MSSIDFKGTDILLEGFARYIRAGGMGELRMVNKGGDVDAARVLIEDLGIQGHVKWLDEMSLAQFYQEMVAADLVCDQFGTSIPGGVTADAYALGRPVLCNLRNEIFGHRCPESLPGFDASTPEEIAEHLISIEHKRDLLAEMGFKCRAYAEKRLSPQSMAKQLLTKLGEM